MTFKVDAYPPVVTYTWLFNSSNERGGPTREMALEHDRFSADGLVSTLEFSPTAGSSMDYGALYCAGENIIGRQAEPCPFNIVPTGKEEGGATRTQEQGCRFVFWSQSL